MKFLVVLAVVVSCACADVLTGEASAPILRNSYESSPDGNNFNFAYETGNKISAQAEGVVKNPNSENAALEVRGGYSYVAPDGTVIQTTYVSNEDGFRPQGSHIPVAPPVPEPIARALQWIAAHPPKVEPTRKL